MAALGHKTPNEVKTFVFDFAARLADAGDDGNLIDADETIAQSIVAAQGTDSAPPTLNGPPALSASRQRVSVTVNAGGAERDAFLLTVRAMATDGQTLEMSRLIRVQAII